MAIPPVQSWVPGLTVAHYVLVREIARGGMGEIWLARQTGAAGFDRLVVLKRVIPGGGADESAMTMFLDEARIASQLNHPNIVQVFELRQEPSSVFLVMEYLAGQTASRFARRMIEKSGQVPAALAVSLIAPAAKALGYAHRRASLDGRPLNIVHRDVSPQNLFVTYEGEVKVLDFGIAVAAGRMARTAIGVIKGKVAYMSPEQTEGGGSAVTGAADVYALGIILFELLTGTRFYGKSDDLGILRRLALSAPVPAPSSRAAVDPELEKIVLQALEPEVSRRFADGQVFFEALETWRRRHPPAPDEPTLQEAMEQLFAQEVSALGEFHREAARTPAQGSDGSMPQRRETRTVAPADPGAEARRTLASPLAAQPIVRSILSTNSAATQLDVAAPRPFPVAKAVGVGVVVLCVIAGAVWLLSRPRIEAQAEAAPLAVMAAPVEAGLPRVEPASVAAAPSTPAPEPRPVVAAPEPHLPAPPLRVVASTGLLTLNSEPWTRVLLGKRVLGETPLVEVPLPVGQHRLRLINESEHVDTVIEVTIKASQTTVKKIAF